MTELWINEKFVLVAQTLEEALYAVGFHARTTVDNQNNISTYVASNGRIHGLIDLRRILLEIATCRTGYDMHLDNPLYEISKIQRVVYDRVRAAGALFCTTTKDEAIARLCTLSRESGVNFTIVQSA